MGNPRGFMTVDRKTYSERDPVERIGDWNEFHLDLPIVDLQSQGSRCMDCGVPFCHTADLMANMAAGCPVRNLIPEWNDLVYRGHWKEALDRLHKTNNFPEFTGRVCPAPCEQACTLKRLKRRLNGGLNGRVRCERSPLARPPVSSLSRH